MTLPAEILQAVSVPRGAKITLVVGAGCSLEAPTAIPLAGQCSEECHTRLVADGILEVGDCLMPWNLSCLADAVVQRTGLQRPLVEQLTQHYSLKTAAPNEGHRLAAALMREGSIASVVTLNFDLALSTAVSMIGGGEIAIIDSPEDLVHQKAFNLYYLHRNANDSNPETWILRTEALRHEWRNHWEQVVVAKVLLAPVVVFAGLGSPADVLIESAIFIQAAIPSGMRGYQVDPVDADDSQFFQALGLERSHYVQATWCGFMEELSGRLVLEHVAHLKDAAGRLVEDDHLTAEDLAPLLNRLEAIGLLGLGKLRAHWLLHQHEYLPDELSSRDLVADLLVGVGMVARLLGATALLFEDGVAEFRRDDRLIAALLVASGRGVKGWVAMEADIAQRQRQLRGRVVPPSAALVAGTRDSTAPAVATPADVLRGDSGESIVLGRQRLPLVHISQLRLDPSEALRAASL